MGTGFPRGSVERGLTMILPVLAVGVVAFTVLMVGRSRPVLGVRLRGGPTEGATSLSFRLEVVARLADAEAPVPSRQVVVDGSAPLSSWRGTLDGEGASSVELASKAGPLAGPVRLRVSLSGMGEPLAETTVQLGPRPWSDAARRRGGFIEGQPRDGLVVRAAPERGVFAVPYRDGLWVEVRRHGAPVAGVVVGASSDGADVEPREAVTDSGGRVRLAVRPREHAVSVALRARAVDGLAAELDVALGVVPGALHATLADDVLLVESPIGRDRAYVAVVTETARVAGGAVPLAPDGRGGSRGELRLPSLPPTGQLWAVVSSEPDLRSGALVGWPLRTAGPEPAKTFDVPDALLADTVGEAVQREAHRVRAARGLAASVAVLSLLLTTLLVVRRARRSRVALAVHLDAAGADQETAARVATPGEGAAWIVAAAVLSLGLAAALVAVFAIWR